MNKFYFRKKIRLSRPGKRLILQTSVELFFVIFSSNFNILEVKIRKKNKNKNQKIKKVKTFCDNKSTVVKCSAVFRTL